MPDPLKPNPERERLDVSGNPAAEQAAGEDHSWKKWGPYLSERQWGTVREEAYLASGKNVFLRETDRSDERKMPVY
jgi:hypothetical protein